MQLTISRRGPLPADASAEMYNRGFQPLLFPNPSSGAYMDAANPTPADQTQRHHPSFLPPKNQCKVFSYARVVNLNT